MKSFSNLRATVLIYTIVLVNISLLMAIVMLNNSSILSNNREVEALETKLTSALKYKTSLNVKYHRSLNSNGSGFIDVVSCPSAGHFTMSGTLQRDDAIVTNLTFSWWLEAHCSGDYLVVDDIQFYFNDAKDDIAFAEYQWQILALGWGTTSTTFSDGDNTLITLDNNLFQSADGYDDDANSDDYRSGSTGSVVYPDLYWDDDSLARTYIYGYASPDADWVNIFWSNSQTNQYIETNTNNDNSIYTKASTASWHIYLDLDRPFDLRVVEFDRTSYEAFNQLKPVSTTEYSSGSGALWYIQADLTLSGSTASAYEFDFPNQDYAIFVNNTWTGVLFYQISSTDLLSGSGIYINPMKDDEPDIIRILGNDILINDQGRYLSKQSEIISGK